MDAYSSGLTVLTAMITPAVLISACGALILSTSMRLGRVVDRARELSDRFEQLAPQQSRDVLGERKLALIFDQLDNLTSRARLLQRSMTTFYLAVGVFVATSVSLGVVGISTPRYSWIPVVLGLIGACFLFYGSVLLIFEARIALASTYSEMDFVWETGKHLAPSELLEKFEARRSKFRVRSQNKKKKTQKSGLPLQDT